MGWMRTLLLGDIGNRLDIEDTERDISKLRLKLRSQGNVDQRQNERIEELERDNVELKLCLGALMRLLVSKGVCTREELEALALAVESEEEADR